MLSFIEGEKVTEPTMEDVGMAADFLLKLIKLSGTDEAASAGFSPASEAFFSVAGVVENIEMRLARLDGVCEKCLLGSALKIGRASCRERV